MLAAPDPGDAPEVLTYAVAPTAALDSAQNMESTSNPPPALSAPAHAALGRAPRLRDWTPGGDPAPSAPTVSQATRRTVSLSAEVGTPLDAVLTHLVAAFQAASGLADGGQVPGTLAEAPSNRPTTRSKPDCPRTLGRPPILRSGEVSSPDGAGCGGFSSLVELARVIHCSYPGLVAKYHAVAAEQGFSVDSHPGFEFVHKGHRVRMFPSYSPKA
jgi:hypothetical protein